MKNSTTQGKSLLLLFSQGLLLAVLGSFFPFLFIIYPSLFLRESSHHGIIKVMGVFTGISVLLGILLFPQVGWMVFTIFGPLLLVLDYCIRTKRDIGITILFGSLIFLLSTGMCIYAFDMLSYLQSGKLLGELITMQREVLARSNMTASQIDTTIAQISLAFESIRQILPALLLLTTLVIVYASYTLAGNSYDNVQTIPFRHLRLPSGILMTGIMALAFVFLIGLFTSEDHSLILNNVLFIINGLFFIQGLAVLYNILGRKVGSKILRFVLLFFLLVIPFTQMILIFLGVLDQVIDIRASIR